MFRRISNTWSLMGAAWSVLQRDTRLLLFPLLSGLGCLLVFASFLIPMVVTKSWHPPAAGAAQAQQILYYGTIFLFYFCTYFVIIFFNVALTACAIRQLQGETATLNDGIREAVSRLPLIIGWALLSATVGLILNIIEERSEKIGQFVSGLLGSAWTIVSFLVVPILVVERKGPFGALKESTVLLKNTWGDQIVGNFSFGMIFFLFALPAIALGAIGIVMGNMSALLICVILAVVYLTVLALIHTALQSIFQAAVYLYAKNGQAPGFSNDLLAGAIRSK